jgi:hypothetical protein
MKQIEASLQTKLNGVTAGHDALSDRLTAFINDQSAAAAAGATADGTAAAVPTVHVFTFTGGPCAGKTTIINELARRLRVAGAAVVVKDEGATADFDAIGGFRSQWAGNVDKLKTLQANMLSGEVHAHEHALAHASLLLEDGRDVVLMCDRSGLAHGLVLSLRSARHPRDWRVAQPLARSDCYTLAIRGDLDLRVGSNRRAVRGAEGPPVHALTPLPLLRGQQGRRQRSQQAVHLL